VWRLSFEGALYKEEWRGWWGSPILIVKLFNPAIVDQLKVKRSRRRRI